MYLLDLKFERKIAYSVFASAKYFLFEYMIH